MRSGPGWARGTTVAERGSAERGSVLVLMPVAALIIVVLGAISVDRAIAFGAQRELVQAAQAAANDAAATGADIDRLRAGADAGPVRLDRARVDRAVRASLVGVDDLVDVAWVARGDVVEVRLVQRVEPLFGRGVPGAPETTTVTATASATIVPDP
jgi:hypothetical protein